MSVSEKNLSFHSHFNSESPTIRLVILTLHKNSMAGKWSAEMEACEVTLTQKRILNRVLKRGLKWVLERVLKIVVM